jgi:hypothetical protein
MFMALWNLYKSNETGRIALGFEVEGTLSVKGPDVPDVVSKSPHEVGEA